MTYYELLKQLRRAYKGRSGAIAHYIVKDNSDIGYSMISDYIDFSNTSKSMLSLRMITARQDFVTFTRTEEGTKWVYENIITKMIQMRNEERLKNE